MNKFFSNIMKDVKHHTVDAAKSNIKDRLASTGAAISNLAPNSYKDSGLSKFINRYSADSAYTRDKDAKKEKQAKVDRDIDTERTKTQIGILDRGFKDLLRATKLTNDKLDRIVRGIKTSGGGGGGGIDVGGIIAGGAAGGATTAAATGGTGLMATVASYLAPLTAAIYGGHGTYTAVKTGRSQQNDIARGTGLVKGKTDIDTGKDSRAWYDPRTMAGINPLAAIDQLAEGASSLANLVSNKGGMSDSEVKSQDKARLIRDKEIAERIAAKKASGEWSPQAGKNEEIDWKKEQLEAIQDTLSITQKQAKDTEKLRVITDNAYKPGGVFSGFLMGISKMFPSLAKFFGLPTGASGAPTASGVPGTVASHDQTAPSSSGPGALQSHVSPDMKQAGAPKNGFSGGGGLVDQLSGIRYSQDASDKAKGAMDCSSLTAKVYAAAGVSGVSGTAQNQFDSSIKNGTAIKDIGALKPGDLMFFADPDVAKPGRTISHVGIFLGKDPIDGKIKMFHTGSKSRPSGVYPISKYHKDHFKGGGRAPGGDSEKVVAALLGSGGAGTANMASSSSPEPAAVASKSVSKNTEVASNVATPAVAESSSGSFGGGAVGLAMQSLGTSSVLAVNPEVRATDEEMAARRAGTTPNPMTGVSAGDYASADEFRAFQVTNSAPNPMTGVVAATGTSPAPAVAPARDFDAELKALGPRKEYTQLTTKEMEAGKTLTPEQLATNQELDAWSSKKRAELIAKDVASYGPDGTREESYNEYGVEKKRTVSMADRYQGQMVDGKFVADKDKEGNAVLKDDRYIRAKTSGSYATAALNEEYDKKVSKINNERGEAEFAKEAAIAQKKQAEQDEIARKADEAAAKEAEMSEIVDGELVRKKGAVITPVPEPDSSVYPRSIPEATQIQEEGSKPKGFFSSIQDSVGGFFSGVASAGESTFNDVVGGAKNMFKPVTEAFTPSAKRVPDGGPAVTRAALEPTYQDSKTVNTEVPQQASQPGSSNTPPPRLATDGLFLMDDAGLNLVILGVV